MSAATPSSSVNGLDSGSQTSDYDSLDCGERVVKRRLKVLAFLAETPLYKRKLGERFDVSVQTTGRDVNALVNDGLLEPRIVEDPEGVRDSYFGFKTSELGEEVLERFLVCDSCGELAERGVDCTHEFQPFREAVLSDGGDI